MNEIAFLKELQGSLTQYEFAGLLGVSQSYVSMVQRGERRLGRMSLEKLLSAFPERRAEILDIFLSGFYNVRDSGITNVQGATNG